MLLWLGVALLLAAAAYLGMGRLVSWVRAQDRYLSIDEVAALQVHEPSPSATPMPTPMPTAVLEPSPTPLPAVGAHGRAPLRAGVVPLPTATFVTRSQDIEPPAAAASTGPVPSPLPPPTPPVPVRIRIPDVGVDRSIVELVPWRNPQTGTWEMDVKTLLRRPGTDLVGHWAGSANPGQPGNLILVGHNYGYGYDAVFLKIGRLRAGQPVYLVNQAGETFTYRVTAVQRVRWSKKSEQELMGHQAFLSMEGEERLTLVTCGGATWEPFPDRVYVVAEPLRQGDADADP